jgi:hypothetical protein
MSEEGSYDISLLNYLSFYNEYRRVYVAYRINVFNRSQVRTILKISYI